MTTDFDRSMDRIQQAIMEEARERYSEKAIEFWLNPKYIGEMESPHGYGKVTGPCGDTIQIFLRIENDRITDARFLTDGCAATVAAGCMACELATGKGLEEASQISSEAILNGLGGLPEENSHCALLASDTLKAAIANCVL